MMSSEDLAVSAGKLAGVEQVECVTPDLNGVPRGKVMTRESFLDGRRLHMARGILLQAIMGGYPPGQYFGSEDGDLFLMPDPRQVHVLPWSDTPRALAICDAQEVDGRPSGLSSRVLLKRIVERYASQGWRPVVATELEFYVFASHRDPGRPFQPPTGLDGRRELNAGFSVSSNNGLRPFFEDVYRCMEAVGLQRDTFSHEMGTSQFELNFLHDDALLLADQTFLFKHLLKEVALQHGLIVVCMAKPLAKMPGSSMHIHQSVVDLSTGLNLFDDHGQETPAFFHFIGGYQLCMREWTALLAPYINSYRRLSHPFLLPNNICWSYDNRMAGLRVPPSIPASRRIENRIPGADANPYLAIAVGLAAGLYGMERQLQPTRPVQGEFEVPHELVLPNTLYDALYRLENSVLAREMLGSEFIDGYLATKKMEFMHFFDDVTPWEREVLAIQC